MPCILVMRPGHAGSAVRHLPARNQIAFFGVLPSDRGDTKHHFAQLSKMALAARQAMGTIAHNIKRVLRILGITRTMQAMKLVGV